MVVAMETTTSHIRSHTPPGITIRPLARADRNALARAFSRLSEETRRRRFGGLAARLSEHELERLTDIDHHEHEAFAVLAPGTDRIVGVARYIALPNDPGAAEVAIAVDDEWQGHGVGHRLIHELAGRARAEGITRWVAYVSSDNHQVLGWIERIGGVADTHEDGANVFTIPLDGFTEERSAA
jgi:GNAT superfamily N-acetyltransferase